MAEKVTALAPGSLSGSLIGKPVERKEDLRLLTGTGHFVDDLRLPGMLHAKILRSPVAHARIKRVDVAAASAMPGVRAVLTARDIEGRVESWGDLMQDLLVGDRTAFVKGKVLYEGQEIAAVAADTRYQAQDAIEAIEVEYEDLPAVVDPEAAMREDAPIIQEGITYEFGDGRNIFDTFRLKCGDWAEAEARAAAVVRGRFTVNRVMGAATEPHGCVAHYDSSSQLLTLYTSTQSVFMVRDVLSKVLHLPRHRVRVIAQDVGGGFGSKAECFPHEVIASVLSLRLGRPVKLMLSRAEVFLVGTARSGQVRYAELAMAQDGSILGYRDRVVHNVGAVSAWGNQTLKIGSYIGLLPYSIPNVDIEGYAVHTNQMPGGALRGFGVPKTLWAKEQLLDMAAEQLGLDPVEVRLRNTVKEADCPFTTSVGQVIDSTSMDHCIRAAAEAVSWDRRRQERKPYTGVGFAVCLKYTSCRHPSLDTDCDAIRIRLETDGTVSVYSSGTPHGQGHETMLSQIVADHLGVDFRRVHVMSADTATSPFGLGTYGSRSAALLGTATREAAIKVRDRVLQIASHILEASPADLELTQDRVQVRGVPEMGLYIETIAAFAAYKSHQLPPGVSAGGIEESVSYDTPTDRPDINGCGNWSATYSGAAHAAVIEVDPGTGRISIIDYAMAHDSGTVINPLVVKGQHDGAFAHGLAWAMYESVVYDEDGRMMNPTFREYYAPYAADMPELEKSFEIPAPSTVIPGGHKGAGETATGPVAAAIANALYDATGIRFTELPITPDKVLMALREKERRGTKSLVFPNDMPDYEGPSWWSEDLVRNVRWDAL